MGSCAFVAMHICRPCRRKDDDLCTALGLCGICNLGNSASYCHDAPWPGLISGQSPQLSATTAFLNSNGQGLYLKLPFSHVLSKRHHTMGALTQTVDPLCSERQAISSVEVDGNGNVGCMLSRVQDGCTDQTMVGASIH